MAQLFINVIGFNASGKTVVSKKLAEAFKLNRLSGDDFRNFVHTHITYFDDTGYFPNERNHELNPLVIQYRLSMLWTLLSAKQSVIFDGSGTAKEERAKYLKKIKSDYPKVTTVIIWADIGEPELLKRLAERDKDDEQAQWTEVYHKFRKPRFEPPDIDEADILLRYDQKNYDEIEAEIRKLLMV